MAKGRATAKADPCAKRMGENDLQWRSRIAKLKQDERDLAEPIVPNEAKRHGSYVDSFLMHVESGTIAKAPRNQSSAIVDKWFAERWPGFEEPARIAINRCAALWEVRPVVGRLCAGYEPAIPGGAPANDYGILSALDDTRELETFASWFPRPYWEVFENVVRHGQPAGIAGSRMANNTPQAISAARNIVGLVANMIAMREGY